MNMSTQIEMLKLAKSNGIVFDSDGWMIGGETHINEVIAFASLLQQSRIDELEKQLSQPNEPVEPYAWAISGEVKRVNSWTTEKEIADIHKQNGLNVTPLFSAPPNLEAKIAELTAKLEKMREALEAISGTLLTVFSNKTQRAHIEKYAREALATVKGE